MEEVTAAVVEASRPEIRYICGRMSRGDIQTRQHDTMTRLLFLFLGGWLLYLGLAIPVYAQCNTALLELAKKNKFGYQERGDRCEGEYSSRPTGSDFEIVSFLIGPFTFEWRENVVLNVSSSQTDLAEIRVRAVGISKDLFYQMDGLVPMNWPVKDVLYPRKYDAAKIGVYGFVKRDNTYYVPLRVSQRGAPSVSEPITLGLRPNINITAVKWKYSADVEGRCNAYIGPFLVESEPGKSLFSIGQKFDIDLSKHINLSTLEHGEVCIQIEYEKQGGSTSKLERIRAILPTGP